jgi:hypothetical protein
MPPATPKTPPRPPYRSPRTQWVGERLTAGGLRHAFLSSAEQARRFARDMAAVGVVVQLHRVQ